MLKIKGLIYLTLLCSFIISVFSNDHLENISEETYLTVTKIKYDTMRIMVSDFLLTSMVITCMYFVYRSCGGR